MSFAQAYGAALSDHERAEMGPGRRATLYDAVVGDSVTMITHDKNITDVAFSPDGVRMASASADGTARV